MTDQLTDEVMEAAAAAWYGAPEDGYEAMRNAVIAAAAALRHELAADARSDESAAEVFKTIEDQLIEMRDARLSVIPAANGLVVNEPDGTPSKIIRIRTRDAVRIVVDAVANRIEGEPQS